MNPGWLLVIHLTLKISSPLGGPFHHPTPLGRSSPWNTCRRTLTAALAPTRPHPIAPGLHPPPPWLLLILCTHHFLASFHCSLGSSLYPIVSCPDPITLGTPPDLLVSIPLPLGSSLSLHHRPIVPYPDPITTRVPPHLLVLIPSIPGLFLIFPAHLITPCFHSFTLWTPPDLLGFIPLLLSPILSFHGFLLFPCPHPIPPWDPPDLPLFIPLLPVLLLISLIPSNHSLDYSSPWPHPIPPWVLPDVSALLMSWSPPVSSMHSGRGLEPHFPLHVCTQKPDHPRVTPNFWKCQESPSHTCCCPVSSPNALTKPEGSM